MNETLIEKANRLGIKPANAPTPASTSAQGGETLAQKANRLGIKPANAPMSAPSAPTQDGLLKTIVKDPIKTLLVKPADRFAEAVGRTGVLGKNIKRGYEEMSDAGEGRTFAGMEVEAQKAGVGGVKQIVGDAAKTASYLYAGPAVKSAVSGVLKGKVLQSAKQAVVPGAISSGAYGFGEGIQKDNSTVRSVATDTAVATGIGAVAAGVFRAATPLAVKAFQRIAPTPEFLGAQVDRNIRKIFEGTTGDVAKIDDMAFRAKKGLELIQKESPNLQIPDGGGPLGSKGTKPFDIQKATPNEMLSGLVEMDKRIANVARTAAEEAKAAGRKINTIEARKAIQNALDNGDIGESTAQRLIKQIDNIGDDPLAAHNWVQEVNIKYKKRYERGTIEDTVLGSLADDIARALRNNLDTIVDRKGYAEAFANNQELKRMVVAIAKKANRSVNFGDITSEAGLDAAISVLTGNPAYMARTVASAVFRGLMGGIRNQSGLKALKSAANMSGKLPSSARMPNPGLKDYTRKIPVKSTPSPFTNEVPTIDFGKPAVSKFKKPVAGLPVAEGAPKVFSSGDNLTNEVSTIDFGKPAVSKFKKPVAGLPKAEGAPKVFSSGDKGQNKGANKEGSISPTAKEGTSKKLDKKPAKLKKNEGKVNFRAAGIGALGLGALTIPMIPSKQVTYQAEPKPASFDREDFSKRIIGIENESLVGGPPEKLYTSVGITGDLGKYQVSPDSLASWGEAWLGKKVSSSEFLKSPKLQEAFWNEYLNVVERLKLTPQEAAVAWHTGWGQLGTGPRETRDQRFRDVLKEKTIGKSGQGYLLKFNR